MIPARLFPNYAAIYGSATTQGISFQDNNLQFGTVSQISGDLPYLVSEGQSVLFKISDSLQITSGLYTYFLVEEQKIILVEDGGAP